MEDHHEFITKSERNKKKDFRKQYTFRHNLDQTNYNNDSFNPRYYHDTHSFWKATQATTSSSGNMSQANLVPSLAP